MHTMDLPKATSINQEKGMLLYCEDGVNLKQIPARLFDGGGGHTTIYTNLFVKDFEYTYPNEQIATAKFMTLTEAVNSTTPFTPQV